MPDAQEDVTMLQGGIEEIAGRVMRGWIGANAETASLIEFFGDGEPLGSLVVTEADAEGGAQKFEFLLPRRLFDGAAHEIAIRAAGRAVALKNHVHCLEHMEGAAPQAAKPAVGALDMVTDHGVVNGWAWYPDRPGERVTLEILVDGAVVGTTLAGLYRGDLAQAGIGEEGRCSFSWPLPPNVLGLPRDAMVSVRDERDGQMVGKPLPFRQKIVADALRKIEELENDIRMLCSTIAALEHRDAQENQATAELFKTVGGFFAELAAASAAGAPPRSLRTQKTALEEATTGLPPFAFRACAAPELTIFIEAAGPASAVYASLHAIFETLGGHEAEIFLLDDGACEDAPLLPLVVQNMRYARLPGAGAVARRNDAMRLAAGNIVVFFAGGITPSPGWAEALSLFDTRPAPALLAARITAGDGKLSGAGMLLRDGFLHPRQPEDDAQAAPVEAAAPECFAIRRSAWERFGGWDERFHGQAYALAEFCLRVRAAGEHIAYAPVFAAAQIAPASEAAARDTAMARADALRLRDAAEERQAS